MPQPAFEVIVQPGPLEGHFIWGEMLPDEALTDEERMREYPLVLLSEELKAAVEADMFNNVNVHMGHSDPLTWVHDPVTTGGVTYGCQWNGTLEAALCIIQTSATDAGKNMTELAKAYVEAQQDGGLPAPHIGLSPEIEYVPGSIIRDGGIYDGFVPLRIQEVYSLDVVDQEGLRGTTFTRQLHKQPQAGSPGRLRLAANLRSDVLTVRMSESMDPQTNTPPAVEQPPQPPAGDAAQPTLQTIVESLANTVAVLAENQQRQGQQLEQLLAASRQQSAAQPGREPGVSAALAALNRAAAALQGGALLATRQQPEESSSGDLDLAQMGGLLMKAMAAYQDGPVKAAQQQQTEAAQQRLKAAGMDDSQIGQLTRMYGGLGMRMV